MDVILFSQYIISFGFMRPQVLRMSSTKYPISALPLVPKSQLLINNLTPDTHTPNPHVFRTKVLTETPSLQRRARVYVISHTHQ